MKIFLYPLYASSIEHIENTAGKFCQKQKIIFYKASIMLAFNIMGGVMNIKKLLVILLCKNISKELWQEVNTYITELRYSEQEKMLY